MVTYKWMPPLCRHSGMYILRAQEVASKKVCFFLCVQLSARLFVLSYVYWHILRLSSSGTVSQYPLSVIFGSPEFLSLMLIWIISCPDFWFHEHFWHDFSILAMYHCFGTVCVQDLGDKPFFSHWLFSFIYGYKYTDLSRFNFRRHYLPRRWYFLYFSPMHLSLQVGGGPIIKGCLAICFYLYLWKTI